MTTNSSISFDKIIGIAGRIGSGKSHVAKLTSSVLRIPRYSFGSYVLEQALQRGLGTNRDTLQNLGDSLVRGLGPEQFLENFWEYSEARGNHILDGIRHVGIWKYVERVTTQAILIHIELDEDIRLERLCRRDKLEVDVAQRYLRHPMEKNVDLLRPEADIAIAGALTKDKLLAHIYGLRD